MDLKKNKIPGVDVSDQFHGLFPDTFYEENNSDIEYDDASFDGVDIDYTTQS